MVTANHTPRRTIEALEAEWDVLRALLRGESFHQFPSDDEIESSVLQAKANLEQCNEEIQRLEAKLISLKQERKLNKKNISGYASLRAPIQKLPPEILQQVFLLVCDENYVGNAAPLCIPAACLTQVCSFWSELVKMTPRLWATITLNTYEARNGEETQAILDTSSNSEMESSTVGSDSDSQCSQWSDGSINLKAVLIAQTLAG